MIPITLVVEPSNPAYGEYLEIESLRITHTDIRYSVILVTTVVATGDVLQRAKYAKVTIDDKLIAKCASGQIVEQEVSAEGWVNGTTGKTPKEGLISLMEAVAAINGITLQ